MGPDDEEDEDANLRFQPTILDLPPAVVVAVVVVVVEGEQYETVNLEEAWWLVEETIWMRRFGGYDKALHTFHASILFPLLFLHYPLSLSPFQALFGFLFFLVLRWGCRGGQAHSGCHWTWWCREHGRFSLQINEIIHNISHVLDNSNNYLSIQIIMQVVRQMTFN